MKIKRILVILALLVLITGSASAALKLWYQMDSADDYTLGQNLTPPGYTDRLYVANNANGVLGAAMTANAYSYYDSAENAVYMDDTDFICKIMGQETPSTLFTSKTQYTFSMQAKADPDFLPAAGGYSFYVNLSNDTFFKCDLGFKPANLAAFTVPGDGVVAQNIWNPAYPAVYVNPAVWNTYTYTWDADNNYIALYVNGILRASSTGLGSPDGVPPIPGNVTVVSYGFGDGLESQHPRGWYKNFRIYDTALNAAEVWSLVSPSPLKLWYQMDSADDFNLGQDLTPPGLTNRLYVANNANGVLAGAMTATAGIQYTPGESAVYMDEVDPCRIVGQEDASSLFVSKTQYTFSLWAKSTAIPATQNGYCFYLFFSDGSNFKADLGFKTTNTTAFTSPGGGVSVDHIWDPTYPAVYVNPATWNMYTYTWDADNNYIALYVNGILRASSTGTGGDVPVVAPGATVTGYGFGDGYGWQGPKGWCRDFRLYDRALDAAEVESLTSSAALKLWYQMDSADDFNLGQDIGGITGRLYVKNNATGALLGGLTSNTGIEYASGEEAIYMDGVDPCRVSGVENGSALFTSRTRYTFSLWAKSFDPVPASGAGYSFYLFFSDNSQFKCDLGFKTTDSMIFAAPGGGVLALNIWNPAYPDTYVDPLAWNMYTYTWDADNNYVALYVNGVLRAFGTGTGGDVPAIASNATVTGYGFGDGYGYQSPKGWYTDFRIWDRILDKDEIELLAYPYSPADGEIVATTSNFDLTLKWAVSQYARSYDVYVGTSSSAVENATHASAEYKGNLPGYTPTYSLTGLNPAVTYYWRIDQVGDGTTDTGPTLSFGVSDVWLYTFHSNVGDLDSDERLCAYAIQGFANTTEAKLFFDTKGGNPVSITADAYWLNYFQTEKGFRFGVVDNLRELIQLAKDSGLVNGGVVLYDPAYLANAGELMPALNDASTQNRLPVTDNMLAYTSKELRNYGAVDCFAGMNISNIKHTWATHLAAQTHCVSSHLSGTPTTGVSKVFQKFATFNDPSNFNDGLDYDISKGYFILDMDPNVIAERTLYDTVMDYLVSPALVYGGWHDEDADIEACSAKGNYGLLSTVNLSFWAHVPANSANRYMRKSTSGKTLDPNKYYVMIQSSDGDAMGHEAGLKPSTWQGTGYWLDPIRGDAKITWTTQPLSATLWPALTEYYVLTSTANDTFCAGPSGAGYCRPGSMSTADQAAFAAFEESSLQLTGLQWVEQWGPWSESMWNTMNANAASIKCFGHQTTPQTVGGRNHWLDDGTPVAIAPATLWYPFLDPTNPADPYNINDPQNIVNKITTFVSTYGKKPPYFITVFDGSKWALLYSKQCQLGLPANYEMVTVEDFMDLMDQAVHPKAWGTLLTYDDFESGFGNWTDGGAYCNQYTGSGDTFSRLGTKAIHIYYKGTPAASFYHTTGINVNTPGYTQIKVGFWYVADGMETGDSFVLEYYNGTTWNTLKTYVSGTDFLNGVTNFRYNVVYINEGTTLPNQIFPSNMKLRFRCTANSTTDHIYIDCVRVEAQ